MLFIIKECRFLGVCGDAKRVCLWVFVDVHELYMPGGLQGSPCGLRRQKDPVVSLSRCSLLMGFWASDFQSSRLGFRLCRMEMI